MMSEVVDTLECRPTRIKLYPGGPSGTPQALKGGQFLGYRLCPANGSHLRETDQSLAKNVPGPLRVTLLPAQLAQLCQKLQLEERVLALTRLITSLPQCLHGRSQLPRRRSTLALSRSASAVRNRSRRISAILRARAIDRVALSSSP